MTATEPTITVLSCDPNRREARVHVEGGRLAEGWAARDGERAWCDLTLRLEPDGEAGWVGAFGGSVWPAAWPDLFTVGPRTVHGQRTTLTHRGLMLAHAAIYGMSGDPESLE